MENHTYSFRLPIFTTPDNILMWIKKEKSRW